MKIICRNNFAQCNARRGNELRDEISELRYDLLLVSRRRTLEEKYRPGHRSYENRPIIIIKKNNLCFAPLNPFCTTLPLSARDRFVRAHIIIRIPAIIVFLSLPPPCSPANRRVERPLGAQKRRACGIELRSPAIISTIPPRFTLSPSPAPLPLCFFPALCNQRPLASVSRPARSHGADCGGPARKSFGRNLQNCCWPESDP